MNKELIFRIIEAKRKNNEAIMEILDIFEAIINKYSRKLNGDDTKQDLYVFLINLINSIDYKSIIKYEDYSKNEIIFGYDTIESNIEVLDGIRSLNTYEKDIIKLIVFNGYKISEIAQNTGKSRQAINQVKNRALKKLKKEYLT